MISASHGTGAHISPAITKYSQNQQLLYVKIGSKAGLLWNVKRVDFFVGCGVSEHW